jgi:hypothetical protein
MREDERNALRGRFRFRCAYCGVRERDAGAQLTVDHFQPRSQGRADEPENWVYCCHACNEFKGDYWQPDSVRRILHPLRDDLGSHLIEEADGTLRALTETGGFHIERLHLNHGPLVDYRPQRRRRDTLRLALTRQLERLKEPQDAVRETIAELNELQRENGES